MAYYGISSGGGVITLLGVNEYLPHPILGALPTLPLWLSKNFTCLNFFKLCYVTATLNLKFKLTLTCYFKFNLKLELQLKFLLKNYR